MAKPPEYFGSIAASSYENKTQGSSSEYISDTDTIAGESTSDSNTDLQSSTNIDVVGLAAFKGDILVRRTYWRRNYMPFNNYK